MRSILRGEITMEREILFRGKRIDNGEWIEGDLLHDYWMGDNTFILFKT